MAGFAVLSVYYTDPVGCLTVDAATADLIAYMIATALIDDPELACLDDTDTWSCLDHHPRKQVAIAVGILTATLKIDPAAALAVLRAQAFTATAAALAVLRAQAFTADRTVDDIAADLVNT